MSYRSFKRVLGETSLERKCRFLFGACLLLLITGSFLWYGRSTEQIVYEQNPKKGKMLVDTIMAVEHWVKLETNEQFLPLVKSLVERLDTEEYEWEAIRPASNRLGDDFKPADEFEIKLLEEYSRPVEMAGDDSGEFTPEAIYRYSERYSPENDYYYYYQPIYVSRSCIDCHRINNPNMHLSEGDLQSVVKVRIPTEETSRQISQNRAWLLFTAIITVFLAMLALYVIVRYIIVKPLKHLRDVSDEISKGNISLRADINTNDEFEELAVAFNRMLRNLIDAQQELTAVNDDLDSKVDELAQTNMRLYEMNRLKNDFMATMSHELRTPLNSIIGFSDVLDSIESLDNKQRRYVQNIQKSGRLLLDMINDILDLAKIESGKMELNLSSFRIDPIVTAQCDMARPLAEKKNIDLNTHVEPDLPELYQDQVKIQQILNNLLSNAIKFTPEGGRIDVSARRVAGSIFSSGEPGVSQGDLLLTVTDTGVGIAEEDQSTIFEKFRQGQTALAGGDAMTREHSGTGLGLSIVMELCRLLGGEVALVSELGKGSSFSVRLPWTLEEQPRLDSPLADELDELTKQRNDRPRLRESVESEV